MERGPRQMNQTLPQTENNTTLDRVAEAAAPSGYGRRRSDRTP